MTTLGSALAADGRLGDPLAAGELLYTRCPVPTATGLAVGLELLGPALRERYDTGLRALQDVADAEMRGHHFVHGLTHLVREGGNIPAIWAYSRGVPTRLVGITWLDEYQAVVRTPASPVREVADLAGRRIAVPASPGAVVDVMRASALRGFERALSTVGLGLEQVEIVPVHRPPLSGPTSDGRGESFDAELDLLASDDVDAVWLKGAGGLAAVRQRQLVEVFRIDLNDDPFVRVNNGTPRTITVRQELLDARPDVVRTFLEVLGASQPTIGDDHARLWQVLAHETHQPPVTAATAYERVAPDSLVPSLAGPRQEALQHQADFLWGQGFIPGPIDVATWAFDVR
jgi:ABC-type nitrate/sulfonate/bicarbonate transport system substrate-binding protein